MPADSEYRQRLYRFIEAMPKVELHRHLEGSIAPETALALARRHHVPLPADDVEGLRAWFRFRDFQHFVQVYLTLSDLLRTPDDFAFIVVAMARDLARQNVRYAEVTFTAYTHLWQNKGLTPDDLIAGLDAGRAEARSRFGVDLAWIIDIPRNLSFDKQTGRYTAAASDPTVEMALAWKDRGVVALGLGGYEVGAPPEPFARVRAGPSGRFAQRPPRRGAYGPGGCLGSDSGVGGGAHRTWCTGHRRPRTRELS